MVIEMNDYGEASAEQNKSEIWKKEKENEEEMKMIL